MEKNCVTRTTCSQLASWGILYWYETSDLLDQTVLINSDHWKHFKKYIKRLFLGGCHETLTVWHPDQWKNGQDFVLLCIYLGFGLMLQVSNMNERLKENAFEHIIKKLISYLISSQLKQVCDMKTDTFWRITRICYWCYFYKIYLESVVSTRSLHQGASFSDLVRRPFGSYIGYSGVRPRLIESKVCSLT